MLFGAAVSLCCVLAAQSPVEKPGGQKEPDWWFKATNIEACSCTMFCPCYFTASPVPADGQAPKDHSGHGSHAAEGEAFCRFNNAFRINAGQWGTTRLDGLKFWMAGDLGGHFADGFTWAVLTFEPSATPKQREAVKAIIRHVFGGSWKRFADGNDAAIEWSLDKDRAAARLDEGNAAEVRLKRNQGMTEDFIVIHNLKFWNAPRNDGFKLMQNQLQAWRVGEDAFETRGTNGFVVTIEMSSEDVARQKAKSAKEAKKS
jgi:hypothetical protein